MTYGAIIVSIVINKLVEFVIQTLNRFERHDRQDGQKANQMIRVWLFYYLNLTFTVLIAYAYSPSVPPALAQAAIFQGSFSDFTSQWCVPSYACPFLSPPRETLLPGVLPTPLASPSSPVTRAPCPVPRAAC